MAGLDYRLVARWLHDLFLLRRDPRYQHWKTPLGVWIQHKKQISDRGRCLKASDGIARLFRSILGVHLKQLSFIYRAERTE